MDAERFDCWTKSIADGLAPRRQLLKSAAGAALIAAIGGLGLDEAEAKKKGKKKGKKPPPPPPPPACGMGGPFGGLSWPFNPGDGQWFIVNGYRGFVDHGNPTNQAQLFGFDFAVCDPGSIDTTFGTCGGATQDGWDKPNTIDRRVLAPVSGQVLWRDPESLGIRIAGASTHVLVIAHVSGLLAQGMCVIKGQEIGRVSGSGNAPHIHMSLYRQISGSDANRDAVPFDGQFAIGAACFYPAGDPSSSGDQPFVNQYLGRLVPCGKRCADGSCGCPGGEQVCDAVCVPSCPPGQAHVAGCGCKLLGACQAGFVCDDPNDDSVPCGPAGTECWCTTVTEGGAQCGDNVCPEPFIDCSSSDECEAAFGPGYFCQPEGSGCCGRTCIAPCGTSLPSEDRAMARSGLSNAGTRNAPVSKSDDRPSRRRRGRDRHGKNKR
ncbi:MAG: hypothetical protein H0V00_17270 [Chloroflexia bacterium]|nr:hypothetical protein [Chloroflexia bacterium]